MSNEEYEIELIQVVEDAAVNLEKSVRLADASIHDGSVPSDFFKKVQQIMTKSGFHIERVEKEV